MKKLSSLMRIVLLSLVVWMVLFFSVPGLSESDVAGAVLSWLILVAILYLWSVKSAVFCLELAVRHRKSKAGWFLCGMLLGWVGIAVCLLAMPDFPD